MPSNTCTTADFPVLIIQSRRHGRLVRGVASFYAVKHATHWENLFIYIDVVIYGVVLLLFFTCIAVETVGNLSEECGVDIARTKR